MAALTPTPTDSSETVEDFLERIASLKIKRDREDEERTRKLEEEIVQGRRERQARRAGEASLPVFLAQLKIGPDLLTRASERARSLSPSKESRTSGNTSFAGSPASTTSRQAIAPPVDLRPSPQPEPIPAPSAMDESAYTAPGSTLAGESARQLPPSPHNPPSPTRSGPTTATMLSRSGTLSWQQRPSSRDSNSSRPRPNFSLPSEVARPSSRESTSSRPRPNFSLPSEVAPAAAPEQLKREDADDFSRKEIAQSLGSKDPTWFRQTADRGAGSAAFRRNQGDATSDAFSTSGRRQLPGMSRESTPEPEKSPMPLLARGRSTSPSHDGSSEAGNRPGDRYSSISSFSTLSDTKSPLLLSDSQRLMPLRAETVNEATPVAVEPVPLQPPQDIISSDRPPSPTKGLGGFVQSAMMKRSDSVNKRWSTQAAPGLKRGDSIAGTRGTLGTFAAVPLTRGGSPPREARSTLGPSSSPSNHSRPGSSHSTSTIGQKPLAPTQQNTSPTDNGPPKLKMNFETEESAEKPSKSYGQSEVSRESQDPPSSKNDVPTSPTKTMDPRRWSPTKASWLESALAKPESPKVLSPKFDQPSWKADLQRSKQSKVEPVESKKALSNSDAVPQASLMRSPPPGGHSRPLSIGRLPAGFSSGMVQKAPKPLPVKEQVLENSLDSTAVSDSEPKKQTVTPTPAGEPPSTETDSKPISETPKLTTSTNIGSPASLASKREAPIVKPKPQTPPKTDFRANLRSRRQDSQDSESTEPEFKNVFGKLRRTETKNYVAPDELKKNILTGKAALNLTGGPQKTKKADEFKESILSKKEAMQAAGGPVHKRFESGKGSGTASQEEPAPLPEALARRKTLSRGSGASVVVGETKPSAPSIIGLKPFIKPPASEKPVLTTSTNIPSTTMTADNVKPSKDATDIVPLKAANPPQVTARTSPIVTAIQADNASAAGKLAGRLNPNLASILMRGPGSGPSSRNQSTEDLLGLGTSTRPAVNSFQNGSDGQLTHMTKGRAKGPKRRLPNSGGDIKTSVSGSSESSESVTGKQSTAPNVGDVTSPQVIEQSPKPLIKPSSPPQSVAKPLAARPLATLVNQNERIKPVVSRPLPKPDATVTEPPNSDSAEKEKPKPVVAPKSPDLRRVSLPKPSAPPSPAVPDAVPVKAPIAISSTTPLVVRSAPVSKSTLDRKDPPKASSLVNGAKASWPGNDKSLEPTAQPSPKSTTDTKEQARANAAESTSDVARLAATRGSPSKPKSPEVKRVNPRAAVEVSSRGASTPRTSANPASTTLTVSATAEAIKEFFDEQPKASDKAVIDTHAIISSGADSDEKTKTVRMQIWEVNGDGKRQDMPPQQEHILFEQCMYLCVHSMETSKGSKATEAFLWCGDGVGEAAIEDAQLFCRKIARENSAKLGVLRQGKETASFIQAIGGIIITRRAKSSALYMLCGRRHLGHVCFDEVDLNAASLCSGFPYIISAKFGKLYLWKGRGSGADELGCARLIGMDLGLTGEIEEVNEDEEPSSFWEAFPGNVSGARISSNHWNLKGNHDQYSCRLFRVEIERPKPAASFWSRRGSSPDKTTKTALIQEITPFCQRDLEAGHIYVLDAYFEIYVFAGDRSTSKSAEFVSALFFAQEYGILAASLQDRPLIPTCHVVLSTAPPDFRAVFRKWSPETHLGNPPQGQKAPFTMSLNAALEALA